MKKIRKLTEEHKRKISESLIGSVHSEETKRKRNKSISEALKGKKKSKEHIEKIRNTLTGRSISKETKDKMSKSHKGYKCHLWKGGYESKNIPMYDTYAHQIDWCEKVKRNKEDDNILEVKCAYCGKWYVPTRTSVSNRINALNGKLKGEHRLYCSNSCKKECPIFGQILHSKDFKLVTSREVQPELRQLVFERDNWTCQKCDDTKLLHCHHVEGIRHEPLESADIDKCITLCKKCHKQVHKKEGCQYNEMQCK